MAKAPASPLRSFFVLLLLGVFLATLALVVRSHLLMRKNPGRPMNEAMRESLEGAPQNELSDADRDAIKEKFPGARENKSGLRQIVRAPGAGSAPRAGQTVAVRYEGRLLDGAVFDSARAGGEPLRLRVETASAREEGGPPRLTVGGGAFGAGWDEALATMRPGEKRTLIVPWWLGPFGAEGHEPVVPPRATLIYEVELVGVE